MAIASTPTARGVGPLRVLAASAVLAAPLVMVSAAFGASLRSLYYPSGWLTLAGLAVLSHDLWKPSGCHAMLRRRLDRQLALGILLAVMFVIHVDYRVPNGVLDLALTGLFVALCVSLVVGSALMRTRAAVAASPAESGRDIEADKLVATWLIAHTSVTWSLLGLAGMHGVIVHCHGLIAHMMLGK